MVKTKSKKFNQKFKWEIIETADMVDSTENIFGVDKKKWNKRGYLGRRMFNEIFQIVNLNQYLFIHPHLPLKVIEDKYRTTTAFNAARTAADSAEGIVEEMMDGVKK